MKLLNFEAWKLLNKELTSELERQAKDAEECYWCDGEGEHECDCGDVHMCPHCDGTGYKDCEYHDAEHITRDMYQRMKMVELTKLAKWGVVVDEKNIEMVTVAEIVTPLIEVSETPLGIALDGGDEVEG